MTKTHILCLGEILYDCLAEQVGKPLAEVTSWTAYPGGAPANVACAVTKLGTTAGFIGCVGNDTPGDELVKLLQVEGVNTTGIQYHSVAPTRQVYVLRSTSGDRSFAGFGKHSPAHFADAYLDSSQLPERLFAEAEFLVLGTLELAYPESRKAVFRALELADIYNLKIVVDVNWRPMFWLDPDSALPLIQKMWRYVDFLKLSAEEAEWLFDTKDAGAIAHRLNSVEGVVVTDGGAGDISYCLNDCEGKVTPLGVSVVDTTGAGDAFVAGLVHQLAQQGITSLNDAKTVKEIVTYACAVGALTTTKPGAIAAQPTAKEVTAFLQEQLQKSRK